jgi:hypothetical protein
MADNNGMQIRFLLIPAGVLLVLVGGALLWRHFSPAAPAPGAAMPIAVPMSAPVGVVSSPRTTGSATAVSSSNAPAIEAPPLPADTVLVKVNGEPVLEKDVAMALPAGSSNVDGAWVREFRLERLIRLASTRQFLTSNAVSVPDDEVEKTLADMRKNPPSLGCPCCRFPTLDAFMQSQYLTLNELRQEIRNSQGLQSYALAMWEARYPEGPKRAELLQKEQPAVERRYAKLYQIFFNTFQQPNFANEPDRVRAEALKKAQAAMARLRKGERFQDVAREVSEDTVSRVNGGDLGCIPLDAFGKEFASAVSALKPGDYSEPIATPWGCHIVLRESMDAADVLDVLKSDYIERRTQEAQQLAQKDAKVEWIAAVRPD